MRLVIVRHGQSIGNQRRVYQGQLDFELTKKGREQAKKTALLLKNLNFDVAYSSDLIRAEQTAREILKFHPNVKLKLTKELRERKGGEIEGKLIDDVKYRLAKWDNPPYTEKARGGESNLDIWNRSLNFFKKIEKDCEGKTLLIVSHFGPISCILTFLKGLGIEKRYDFSPSKNTSVSIIEFNEGKPTFTKLNCDKHLLI